MYPFPADFKKLLSFVGRGIQGIVKEMGLFKIDALYQLRAKKANGQDGSSCESVIIVFKHYLD